jgi:hypothetical protein
MTDNGAAALAAALHATRTGCMMAEPDVYHLEDAAALLAALPPEWGWREGYAENMNRLLQANLDYSAEIDRLQSEMMRDRQLQLEVVKEANAELARLRAALDELIAAGQAVLDWYEPERWAGPHDWLKEAIGTAREAP